MKKLKEHAEYQVLDNFKIKINFKNVSLIRTDTDEVINIKAGKVYKFEKYIIPAFKNDLKEILEKYFDDIFQIWKFVVTGKPDDEDLFSTLINLYVKLKPDIDNLTENIKIKTPGRVKDLPFQFSIEDNKLLFKLSVFLKVMFPIYLLPKYEIPYIEKLVNELQVVEDGISDLLFKLNQLFNFKSRGLFYGKASFMNYMQYSTDLNESVFLSNLNETFFDALPFMYDVKNPIGYIISIIGKYINFIFLEVITKSIQYYETVAQEGVSINRRYRSFLIDLDLENHVATYLKEFEDFTLEQIMILRENKNKLWNHSKYVIVPYFYMIGYDYGDFVLSKSMYLFNLYFYFKFRKFFKVLSNLLVSVKIKSFPVERISPKKLKLKYDLEKFLREKIKNISEVFGEYENLITGDRFTITSKNFLNEYYHFLKTVSNQTQIVKELGYLSYSPRLNIKFLAVEDRITI